MKPESEERTGALAAAKALAKKPAAIAAAALVLYVAKDAAWEHLVKGVPVSEIGITLWSAVWRFADNPLVELALIALAIWMFGRAVRRVLADQAAHREAVEAAQTRETKIQQEALNLLKAEIADSLRLPTLFARLYLIQQQLAFYGDPISAAKSAIDAYAEFINLIETERLPLMPMSIGSDSRTRFNAAQEAVARAHHVLGRSWEPLTAIDPVIDSKKGRIQGERTYKLDLGRNAFYLHSHRENVKVMRAAVRDLETLVEAQQMGASEMAARIHEEAKRLHG